MLLNQHVVKAVTKTTRKLIFSEDENEEFLFFLFCHFHFSLRLARLLLSPIANRSHRKTVHMTNDLTTFNSYEFNFCRFIFRRSYIRASCNTKDTYEWHKKNGKKKWEKMTSQKQIETTTINKCWAEVQK